MTNRERLKKQAEQIEETASRLQLDLEQVKMRARTAVARLNDNYPIDDMPAIFQVEGFDRLVRQIARFELLEQIAYDEEAP